MISKTQRHFTRTDRAFFKKLAGLAEDAIKGQGEHEQRALRVFEVFAWSTQARAAGKGLTEEQKNWLDETIRRDLDHQSIDPFIQMVLSFQKSMEQSQNGLAAHTENHAMRDQIYAWLDANKTPKMSMDTAADHIKKVVPLAWRTVRDHVGEWKKVREAGKA